MTCTDARRHWMLYLDSEGDPQLHLLVGDHLAACPACAAWFDGQQRLERALRARVGAGVATPELWERILDRAGVRRPARRCRTLALAGALAAAFVLLAAFLVLRPPGTPPTPPLSQHVAELHDGWLRGEIRPDFESTSELEVDRFFKANAPFRAHCPPRADVRFAVQGAGVRALTEGRRAAYIVGRIGQAPVSILVLDRDSLSAFPLDADRLRGGRRHRCREGSYQMVSGVVADNVVVVIGNALSESLEKLLDAYGSYHDG